MLRFVAAGYLVLALVQSASAQVVLSQNFDMNPGWTLLGNGANNNNFGYRTTSLAGGNPGEAGGRFTRSNFDQTYANTNLGGALTLDTLFAATGRLVAVSADSADLGYGLIVGYFNPLTRSSIGLMFNQDLTSPDGLYLDAIVRINDSTVYQARLSTSPAANVTRTWNVQWDPVGGVLGGGRLSAAVSGIDGGSAFIDLTPADRALAPTFDAFGMYAASTPPTSGNPIQPNWFVETYIDNLNYTAVPEPGSLALGVFGTLGVAATRLIKRRMWPVR